MANEFLDDLFGSQNGFVYAPVKGETWQQHFFAWPQERQKLEEHLEDYNDREVYISPVLFSQRKILPETFKGTRYLWSEFDGKIPGGGEIIEPTMRVLSSVEGHEHWYWRLEEFITDKVLVEDLTKRLAYHYGADLSCYDYQQVLRPPDTWNHKRNKPVTLLQKTDTAYPVEHFLWVPIPPAGASVSILDEGNLPSLTKIVAKYAWQESTIDLLLKTEVKEGKRSDALARLAHDAIEVGCSNEETYVLIEHLDKSLGKFVGRTDRHRQLEGIISYVRARHSVTADLNDTATEVYRFHDFMKTEIKMKWVIEGLYPVAGSMVVLGTEGVGKSTLLLRLAESLGLENDRFLVWKIARPQKVLFVSLEMQHEELLQFLEDMQLTEEQKETLQERFFIWPIGHAYPFDTPDQQLELLKYIDLHKIDTVIFDSLGTSTYGSIKEDETIKRLNAFLNEDLRKKRKCGYIFIHHLRKKGIGELDKETDLDESFGSKYITTNAQTIVVFSQKKGSVRLNIKLLKTRHVMGSRSFDVERTSNRGFQLVDSTAVNGEASSTQVRDASVPSCVLKI